MKICFFNLNIYSLFNPKSKAPIGGTEIQLYNLARYFSDLNGYVISVITGDWGQDEIEKIGKIDVFRSVKLKKNIFNYFKAPFVIWNLLKKIDADIYIASAAGMEDGLIVFFCKINGKKFIYRTASSIDCDGTYIKRNGLRGKIFRYGLQNSHAVIAQNKQNKALLKKTHDIEAVIIKNSFVIDNPGVNIHRKHILWVGHAEPNKQPELFFRVAEKFPEQKFLMICPKRAYHITYFEKIKNNAGRIKNLIFMEKVPFDGIQEYFNATKIFICTSKYEGFPNVHIQSFMAGAPVITLNINPDDYINKSNVGYFSSGNFSLMLEQIKKITLDGHDWEEKSKKAYAYAKDQHDIEVNGKRWEKLFYELIIK